MTFQRYTVNARLPALPKLIIAGAVAATLAACGGSGSGGGATGDGDLGSEDPDFGIDNSDPNFDGFPDFDVDGNGFVDFSVVDPVTGELLGYDLDGDLTACLLYTSPSPRDRG